MPPKGALKIETMLLLFYLSLFLLLMLDISFDNVFVDSNSADKITSRPKTLADEVLFPTGELTRNMDCAFPLDVPDDLRNRMLWGYRYQHVYVVGQQMPLLHLALLLPR